MLTPVDVHYYTTAFIADDDFQPGDKLYVLPGGQLTNQTQEEESVAEVVEFHSADKKLRIKLLI